MAVIGYIYAIVSDMTDKVYIGSTKLSLNTRFSLHKSKLKLYNKGKYHYVTSYEILAFPDARIDLLETVYDGENLKEIEQAHINDNPNAVNQQRAVRRDPIHHCLVCGCFIKLSNDGKGGYSTGEIYRHERTNKHKRNSSK